MENRVHQIAIIRPSDQNATMAYAAAGDLDPYCCIIRQLGCSILANVIFAVSLPESDAKQQQRRLQRLPLVRTR
jgi:hypothetical protein